MLLTFVAIAGASYLVGSLPTAYLLVKWKTQRDLRTMGTGNIGALNSYEVTRSKFVGLSVLVVDLAKGALVIMLTRLFSDGSLALLGLAAVGVVLGHNYPLWLGFQGGRGLATAAGAFLLLNWLFVVVWGVIWAIVYFLTKNIHKGNIAAIVLTPFISIALSGRMVEWEMVHEGDTGLFILFGFLASALLFLRHLQPLREMLSRKPS